MKLLGIISAHRQQNYAYMHRFDEAKAPSSAPDFGRCACLVQISLTTSRDNGPNTADIMRSNLRVSHGKIKVGAVRMCGNGTGRAGIIDPVDPDAQ